MRSKAEKISLNSTALILGISNLHSTLRVDAIGGGFKGVIESKKMEALDTKTIFSLNTTLTFPDMVKNAFTIIRCADKKNETPVSYYIFCNLDDEKHQEFLNEWVNKVNQVKRPQDELIFIGLSKEHPTEDTINSFNNKWQGAFQKSSFELTQDSSLKEAFVESKLKEHYSAAISNNSVVQRNRSLFNQISTRNLVNFFRTKLPREQGAGSETNKPLTISNFKMESDEKWLAEASDSASTNSYTTMLQSGLSSQSPNQKSNQESTTPPDLPQATSQRSNNKALILIILGIVTLPLIIGIFFLIRGINLAIRGEEPNKTTQDKQAPSSNQPISLPSNELQKKTSHRFQTSNEQQRAKEESLTLSTKPTVKVSEEEKKVIKSNPEDNESQTQSIRL